MFCEQRKPGGFAVWADPFTCLRVPKIFNLRMDPFERADIVSDQYNDWLVKNAYLLRCGVWRVATFLEHLRRLPAEPALGELQHRPDDRGAAAESQHEIAWHR